MDKCVSLHYGICDKWGYSTRSTTLVELLQIGTFFMMESGINVSISIMIFAMNGSRLVEYLFHAIFATWNMFYGRTMDDCVLFHHYICNECV